MISDFGLGIGWGLTPDPRSLTPAFRNGARQITSPYSPLTIHRLVEHREVP
jgi:hypothetical protein